MMRTLLSAEAWVAITIRDSGKGMNQETVRRIFEPFFTTKFEGRGLGMAMALGIVKNHQGMIQVTSHIIRDPGGDFLS